MLSVWCSPKFYLLVQSWGPFVNRVDQDQTAPNPHVLFDFRYIPPFSLPPPPPPQKKKKKKKIDFFVWHKCIIFMPPSDEEWVILLCTHSSVNSSHFCLLSPIAQLVAL